MAEHDLLAENWKERAERAEAKNKELEADKKKLYDELVVIRATIDVAYNKLKEQCDG